MSSPSAVDELVRRINDAPGELTIIAQAPLTSIALKVQAALHHGRHLLHPGQHHTGGGVQLLRRPGGGNMVCQGADKARFKALLMDILRHR
mgnify:CR=1 FL=1